MGAKSTKTFADSLKNSRAKGLRCVIGVIDCVSYPSSTYVDPNRMTYFLRTISPDGVNRTPEELYDYALTNPQNFQVVSATRG